jgi:hypothetical protein
MLPKSIEDLILLEFHDVYDTIEKRKLVNFVIESGYRAWLRIKTNTNRNLYSMLEREHRCKLSIWLPNPFYYYSWVGFEPIFPLAGEWDLFLRNIHYVDRELYRRKLKTSVLDLII